MKSASYRSASVTASFADLVERLAVGFHARPHGDGELQVSDGAGSLAGAGAGEGQSEVRVVVDGGDLDGFRALPSGPGGPAREAAGPSGGLASRSLGRPRPPG